MTKPQGHRPGAAENSYTDIEEDNIIDVAIHHPSEKDGGGEIEIFEGLFTFLRRPKAGDYDRESFVEWSNLTEDKRSRLLDIAKRAEGLIREVDSVLA